MPLAKDNIKELVKYVAFEGKGAGVPLSGLGNVLTNSEFLAFQRKISPKNIVISLSNVSNPDDTVKTILYKIKTQYPQCKYTIIQFYKEFPLKRSNQPMLAVFTVLIIRNYHSLTLLWPTLPLPTHMNTLNYSMF